MHTALYIGKRGGISDLIFKRRIFLNHIHHQIRADTKIHCSSTLLKSCRAPTWSENGIRRNFCKECCRFHCSIRCKIRAIFVCGLINIILHKELCQNMCPPCIRQFHSPPGDNITIFLNQFFSIHQKLLPIGRRRIRVEACFLEKVFPPYHNRRRSIIR